jgi:murein DD-endopeptidase MepM/ murein hydrolase activator NlpD
MNSESDFVTVYPPFASGTEFFVHQGPLGHASHRTSDNAYAWDLDVPFGTPVHAVEAGTVLQVFTPGRGGGCDERFAEFAHNVKVEHADGTVVQYLHVDPTVKAGDTIEAGSVIATTARSGFLCVPHLHLSAYPTREHLPGSGSARTVPLRFEGLGPLIEGQRYRVP